MWYHFPHHQPVTPLGFTLDMQAESTGAPTASTQYSLVAQGYHFALREVHNCGPQFQEKLREEVHKNTELQCSFQKN